MTDGELWIRDLSTDTARQVEGVSDVGRSGWSSDSRFVAFDSEGSMYKVPVDGGRPTKLCDQSADNGGGKPVWSPDGSFIVFAGTERTLQVSANGGTPVSWREDEELGAPMREIPSAVIPMANGSGAWLLSRRERASFDIDVTLRAGPDAPGLQLSKGRKAVYSPSGHVI